MAEMVNLKLSVNQIDLITPSHSNWMVIIRSDMQYAAPPSGGGCAAKSPP
jgi:hypothetical protein